MPFQGTSTAGCWGRPSYWSAVFLLGPHVAGGKISPVFSDRGTNPIRWAFFLAGSLKDFYFILDCSRFTVLCQFQMDSREKQL